MYRFDPDQECSDLESSIRKEWPAELADDPRTVDVWKHACEEDFRVWFETATQVRTKDGKMSHVVLNSMQRRLMEAEEWCKARGIPARFINLKPRQGGSSTYGIARAYHAVRSQARIAAIIGDDHNTTDKLFKMWRRFALSDAMPWEHGPVNPRKPSWMQFENGGNLELETANDQRAGQGGTYQYLIASEVASYRASGHATGEDVFSSIAACVPNLPDTLILLESTAQGMSGIFYNTYQGALTFEQFKAFHEGRSANAGNGYIKFFTPWFEFDDYQFDGRDGRRPLQPMERAAIMGSLDEREARLIKEFGEEKITPERLAWRRETIAGPACSHNPDKFDREYPKDDISCFRQSGSVFFDFDGVRALKSSSIPSSNAPLTGNLQMPPRSRAPLFIRTASHEGWLRIWEQPKPGLCYILPIDFMVGKMLAGSHNKRDHNAYGIIRAEYVDPVTRQHHRPKLAAALQLEDQASTFTTIDRVKLLYHLYGDCLTVPEINNKDNIAHQLVAAGVTNIWTQKAGGNLNATVSQGKDTEVMGWFTHGGGKTGGTKKQILDNLAEIIRQQQFECFCPEVARQLEIFIRDHNGSGAAPEGDHDDWVMMLAIGLFCIGSATPMPQPLLGPAETPGGRWAPVVQDPHAL